MTECSFCGSQFDAAAARAGQCPKCGRPVAADASDDGSGEIGDQTLLSDDWSEEPAEPADAGGATAAFDDADDGRAEPERTIEESGFADGPADSRTFLSDEYSEESAEPADAGGATLPSNDADDGRAEPERTIAESGFADGSADSQTFISDEFSEESAEPADAGGATFLSDDGDDGEPAIERTIAESGLEGNGSADSRTFVSDDLDADVLHTIKTAWSGEIDEAGRPEMTIRGRSRANVAPKSTLVIKSRALRKHDEPGLNPEQIEYELISVLGEGGMGVVYDARQTSIDRSVAVKMIKAGAGSDKQGPKFLAEAVITGDLDHPNIVPIYDVGRNEQGALFYSMKKVEGTPWQKVIRRKSLPENVDILMKVADAVAFAHARGVLHRDLKPENVMLGAFGEVLVMDWGLAQPLKVFRKSSQITGTVGMGGTPAYMAPEMATGPLDRIGPASDVYLLGAMLYEIITGRPPHRGDTVGKCLAAAARNVIQPTDKSGELVEIARKAMASAPEDRYAGVPEFQAAIREYQSHSESVLLTARAEEDLVRAAQSDDYQDYARALFAFEEAADLWDRNRQARQGVSKARLAYAQTALRKGDLDLGASLLTADDRAHDALRSEIAAARQERTARQQRLKVARRAAVGLAAAVFLVVTVAFFWIRAEREVALVERARAVEARDDAERQRSAAELARHEEEAAKNNALVAQKQAEDERQRAELARREEEVAKNNAVVAQKEAEDERQRAELARQAEEYEAYVARIGLAAAKIDENAFDAALQLLNDCKPGLRHWEWGRLMHLCSQSSRTFDGDAPLDALAVSPDGRRIITGGWDGTARIWDAQTGEELHRLVHQGLYVHAVAWSSDGRFVATGGNDSSGSVRLWDAETGKPLRSFPGHSDAVLSVAFSRDGRRLLTGSYDRTARLWDVETGRQVRSFVGHNWWVWRAAFSPDEGRIVTASQDGTVLVWSVETGEKSAPFTGHQGPVYAAEFSPDGSHVATAGYDKRVLVWKPDDVRPYDFRALAAGESAAPPEFRAFDGHTAAVRAVGFSSDGSLIVSGGHDNTVRVWNLEAGKPLKTFRGHGGWVRGCAFAPDGRAVLSVSHDHRARLWSIADYEEIRVLQGRRLVGHEDAVLAASFSRDGRHVITSGRDRTARLWDARSGEELKTFEEGHSFLASSALFSPDGRRLFTGAVDNTVRVWDVATGAQLLRLDRTGRSAALALSPDAKRLLTGSDRRTARLWDTQTGELIRELEEHNSEVTAVAVSPDGRRLFTGDAKGHGVLWDADTGRRLHRLEAHSRKIVAAAFLPDGSGLLTASGDRTVGQWDVATGQERRDRVLKHPEAVTALAVSRDGRQVVTGCADGNLRLWSAGSPDVVRTLNTGGPINAVDLSPDGRQALTAASEDRAVRLWDLENGREVLAPEGPDRLGPFLNLAVRGGLVWSARFSPDGGQIVTVGGNEARLWDARSGDDRMTFSPHGAVAAVGFSPDGHRIVTGSWDNSAKIWNVVTGRSELKLVGAHAGFVNVALFSPDGRHVLTASDDRTAKLWDAETGELVRTYEGHADRVRSALFSRDGRRILTTSNDRTARLWDVETGEPLRVMEGHRWAVVCADLSADGTRAITGSEDNTARVWDLDTGHSLLTLQGHTAGIASVALSPDGRRALTGSQDYAVRLWDARTGKEILTLSGHAQEVTAVAFSPEGRSVLTAGRDGHALLWPAANWTAPHVARP